jgi:hypothetical protein
MQNKLTGKKLLLMGSKFFKAEKLPPALENKIDEAIKQKMIIIVGEVPGSCWLFQDYLKSKDYKKVIVGYAKSIRYNAGNWETKQYGFSVPEREQNMIDECDSAIIIWTDKSGVIAENLELLKRLEKPVFLYEYTTKTKKGIAGWLDRTRVFDSYYDWKNLQRKYKYQKK